MIERASRGAVLMSYLLRGLVGLPVEALLNAAARGRVSPRRLFEGAARVDRLAAILPPSRGVRREPVEFDGGFAGEWLRPEGTVAEADSVILYLHGGAYFFCGLNTHRHLATAVGRAAGAPVLSVAYRQLPQAHLARSIDDAVTAYRYLLDRGIPARRILICGDSAGGGLTFLAALAIRDRGLPRPGGLAAMSPWADLDNEFRLAHPNSRRDPILRPVLADVVVPNGFTENGVLDPQLSSTAHDFTGLPPILIQVGSTEMFLPDAQRLADRAAAAAIPCTLEIYDRAPHVFQVSAPLLPRARRAVRRIGEFARATLSSVPRD